MILAVVLAIISSCSQNIFINQYLASGLGTKDSLVAEIAVKWVFEYFQIQPVTH